MEDSQIIDLYWARDQRALAETADRYGRYCRSIALAVLGNEADSEECVNDAWLKVWDSIPPHRPDSLKAYLGKLTRNLSLNRLRSMTAAKRGGEQADLALEELSECLPGGSDPARELEGADLTALLDRFLAALPDEQRRIFLQRYWYFCTVKEISQNLGVGESKVKMTLSRTRQKLKEQLWEGGFLS